MTRPIHSKELPLVRHLLNKAGIATDINALRVSPMDDGGMGSLLFASSTTKPELGSTPAECSFVDSDGVLVSATLILDKNGALFELDVWKVDYSPLNQWPSDDSSIS